MITGDYHTHGSFSHGKGSAAENAREAHCKKLKSIAITEHGMFTLIGGLRAKQLQRARQEIADAQKQYPDVKIYFGIEANLISPGGDIDIPEIFKNEFEIVLLGLHYFVKGSGLKNIARIIGRNFFRKFFRRRDILCQMNTEALVKAMHKYDIDALAHLGTSMPDYDIAAVARAAEETDTCIELNNKHCSLSLEQLKFLADTNVKFLLNSDAHEPANVGTVERVEALAFEAGIRLENILNLAPNEYIPKRLRGGGHA